MPAHVPQAVSGEGLSEILGQEDAAASDYPPGWCLGLIPSYRLFLHLQIELLPMLCQANGSVLGTSKRGRK